MTGTITVEKDVMVATRDGVRLATDVYRPANAAAGGGVPTLVQRTPYDKELSLFRNYTLELMQLVRAGYAVVVQDVRGRFASEGAFDPLADDGRDGADTIAWVREQPWCSGTVGMFGASYYGATQWRAAAEAGDATGALAPGVTPADYHDGLAYQGGAFQLGLVLNWTLAFMATGELVRRMSAGEDVLAQLGGVFQAIDENDRWYEHRPLLDVPPLGELVPYYREWLRHPSRDAYWRALAPDDRWARTAAPALLMGGWYDLFLAGTLASYRAMREQGATPAARRPKLVIGPWAHGNLTGTFPERSYGFLSAYPATDPTGLHLRWFDRHLRGAENGVDEEPPVRLFVMGADEWRDAEDWPLPGTRYADWHLHGGGAANTAAGDGTLSAELPGDEPADAYDYDPRDPVPTVGGATFLPGVAVSANAGPRDQAPLAQRRDVLTYVSAPLVEDLEVIGPVELVLFASSSTLDTDFTGKLVDVHPDGRAELLTDGILRARFRDSLAEPRPLEPGRVYELRIELGATANVFRAGHRIRLDVSSSNFPRFDRNTNSGGEIAAEGDDACVVARNRVFHDAARPSRLVLPVVPTT